MKALRTSLAAVKRKFDENLLRSSSLVKYGETGFSLRSSASSTEGELEQVPLGAYLIVQAALPDADLENIGILLFDVDSNRLHSRFRRDVEELSGDEQDWFEALPAYVLAKSQELGGQKCLEWMESMLSNTLRISGRKSVAVHDYDQTLHRLYAKHVRPKVLPFRTHLPKYTLEAAAGKFGKQMDVEPEGWVEAQMFVAHVKGRSMEPDISDGSLCAFNSTAVGSPEGKVVLVEDYGEPEGNRYAIKRYRSAV